MAPRRHTHAIEDGYRGTGDAEKMTIEQGKKPCMMARPFSSCAAALSIAKGDDRYVFRDKCGEINVIIPSAVFDGREVQRIQMININGSLDESEGGTALRSREPTAK